MSPFGYRRYLGLCNIFWHARYYNSFTTFTICHVFCIRIFSPLISLKEKSQVYTYIHQQARKGFRPLSAIFVIIIFWIFFGIFCEFLWSFLKKFWEFFWRIFFLTEFFWWNFLGEIFWEDFSGRILWEDFFVEDFFLGVVPQKVEYWKKWFVCQYFGFCQDFVLKERKEGRKEGKFKSLEVRLQVHRT